ncbi:hypothetical protein DFH09DRAFT_1080672 [Mycena vulgaris]|nr:hypothetical protein DFH09DRAFT_1080672 [Mycena vulgaris]
MRFITSTAATLCILFSVSSAVVGQGDIVGREAEVDNHKASVPSLETANINITTRRRFNAHRVHNRPASGHGRTEPAEKITERLGGDEDKSDGMGGCWVVAIWRPFVD